MKAIQKKVVVIGELNVDVILNNIHGFPEVGKEIIADRMMVTLGSSSAIFASNLSGLGTQVAFIGRIGKDQYADLVLSSLDRKKVDTGMILQSDTAQTGATIVLNYDQDRAMVTYPGAMNELSAVDIDFEKLRGINHVHFSSYFLQPGIRAQLPAVFRKIREMGITTSLDPQWDPEENWDFAVDELLPWVNIFLPNEAEFRNILKVESIEAGMQKLKHLPVLPVVKSGTEGAYAWNGKEILHQKAFMNNEVVDCIGAGDSFNAGFIYHYAQGRKLEECMRFGALTGAVNTTCAGGTGAFENFEMVKRIALEKFNITI